MISPLNQIVLIMIMMMSCFYFFLFLFAVKKINKAEYVFILFWFTWKTASEWQKQKQFPWQPHHWSQRFSVPLCAVFSNVDVSSLKLTLVRQRQISVRKIKKYLAMIWWIIQKTKLFLKQLKVWFQKPCMHRGR